MQSDFCHAQFVTRLYAYEVLSFPLERELSYLRRLDGTLHHIFFN